MHRRVGCSTVFAVGLASEWLQNTRRQFCITTTRLAGTRQSELVRHLFARFVGSFSVNHCCSDGHSLLCVYIQYIHFLCNS